MIISLRQPAFLFAKGDLLKVAVGHHLLDSVDKTHLFAVHTLIVTSIRHTHTHTVIVVGLSTSIISLNKG